MQNVFKQRTYECECGKVTKEYVWEKELDTKKVKCEYCPKLLTHKNLVKVTTNPAASIRTPTKNR